jgi:hypothetical protein
MQQYRPRIGQGGNLIYYYPNSLLIIFCPLPILQEEAF